MDEPITPLSMAVLLALMEGPRHGYALMQEVEAQTGRRPGTGTLYAALDRLSEQGLIRTAPVNGGAGDARRRNYEITASGVTAARGEAARMLRVLDDARARALYGRLSELRKLS